MKAILNIFSLTEAKKKDIQYGGNREKDKCWNGKMMGLTISRKHGGVHKKKKNLCVIKTTNKIKADKTLNGWIYYGYILATKVRVGFLKCYKVFCQVRLLFGSFFSYPLTALSLSLTQSEHILSFIGLYSTVLCALYPGPGLVPEASQSHSWNLLAIKPRDRRRRGRDSLPLSSTNNQLHLQPSYKNSIEPLVLRNAANDHINRSAFPNYPGRGPFQRSL